MSCDCQYELIYQMQNGCVYESCCGLIYLEYGNLSMTFQEGGFLEFSRFIEDFDMDEAHHFLRPPNNKVIIQPSKHPHAYAFLLPEIQEMKMLLWNTKNIRKCLKEAKSILKVS